MREHGRLAKEKVPSIGDELLVHFVDHCLVQQKQPLARCIWQNRILELLPRPTVTLVPFEKTVAVEIFTLGAPSAAVRA